jgi:lipopolysaccharide exporter
LWFIEILSLIEQLWSRAKSSSFLQSVAILGSGTLMAQMVTFAAAPVLTRLYTPFEFGLAAVFLAIVSSVAPAVCGKYNIAVVVTTSLRESRELVGISLWFALSISVLFLLGVWVFDQQLMSLLGAEKLGNWFYVVPASLFLGGAISVFNYYSNKCNEFAVISQSKVLLAAVNVTVAVSLGVFGVQSGLIVGGLVASATVSVWLVYKYRTILGQPVLIWNQKKISLMRKYSDFPVYNASTGLLDGITLALPIFFLSSFFSDESVGYYALMLRVAVGPLGFLSASVSQVHLKKVSDLVQMDPLSIRLFLFKVTAMLGSVVLPLTLFIILYAPQLFAFIFGEEWRVAGGYLQILMPALGLRFIASTVSSTFGATGHNRLGGFWKVCAFVVTLGVYFVMAPRVDLYGMFMTIMVTDLVLYAFLYSLVWYAAGHPRRY